MTTTKIKRRTFKEVATEAYETWQRAAQATRKALTEQPAQPAQRTWIGLTDEEISEIAINNPPMVHEFARAIEAKLRSKNEDRN